MGYNCRFCGKELIIDKKYGYSGKMQCFDCPSRIPNDREMSSPLAGFLSKCTVYFPVDEPSLVEEHVILGSASIELYHYLGVTKIGEYIFGGPMDVELIEIIIIPEIINPLDPEFKNKLKLWQTFS